MYFKLLVILYFIFQNQNWTACALCLHVLEENDLETEIWSSAHDLETEISAVCYGFASHLVVVFVSDHIW